MLYPKGTFVDDVIVHKLGENDYLIVINAGTREKDVAVGAPDHRPHARRPHQRLLATTTPSSPSRAPAPQETLQKLTAVDLVRHQELLVHLGHRSAASTTCMIARTGYTGEDGFEIYIPSDEPTSARVWDEILEAGEEFGILPCGLGARNTLRLEAAMALYGHEISDTHQRLRSQPRPLRQARQGPGLRRREPCSTIQDARGPARANSSASR